MIIPRYWSGATAKEKLGRRQFTLKRFGWSDIDEQHAHQHAQTRLDDALATLRSQGDVRRIDHKVPYNGAEGIPIREEIVEMHDDAVISRNSYGALCLNTADVFFADVDFETSPRPGLGFYVFVTLAVFAVFLGWWFQSGIAFSIGALVAVFGTAALARKLSAGLLRLQGGVEKKAMTRIERVSKRHPELHLRVYRTPLGLRVLLMNDTYAAASEQAQRLLRELGSDPVYMEMCLNQQCFRARVSPKPWRIGLSRMTVTGVWPVSADRLPARQAWVSAYERKAGHYASCRFLCDMGARKVSPRAEQVRRVHDHLCRAHDSRLELA